MQLLNLANLMYFSPLLCTIPGCDSSRFEVYVVGVLESLMALPFSENFFR